MPSERLEGCRVALKRPEAGAGELIARTKNGCWRDTKSRVEFGSDFSRSRCGSSSGFLVHPSQPAPGTLLWLGPVMKPIKEKRNSKNETIERMRTTARAPFKGSEQSAIMRSSRRGRGWLST